jgi:hypothetical protein
VAAVPIVTEEQLKKALTFLTGIASMIANRGLINLRLKEETGPAMLFHAVEMNGH